MTARTYTNRRPGRGGTTDGENDRRVVVLALIADEGDKAETNKLCGHLRSFLPTNDRCKVAEPFKGGYGGKTVLLDGCSRTTDYWLRTLGDVHESEAFRTFLVCPVRVKRLEVLRGVVWLTTDETAEEGGDDGLRNDDLVINRPPFKMEKFHANRLCLEDVADVVRVDSVLADEPLEDMETLWSELVNATLLKKVG